MLEHTKASVVILNYNGRAHLERFLPSVVANTDPAMEIVMIDNASQDDSVSFIANAFPSVRIICLDANLGFAGGYNEGLRQVSSDYYILLNSDVEVTPGWGNILLDTLEKHPDAAAVQPKIRSFAHRHQYEHAGAAGGFMDTLGYPFCRGRIFDVVEEDQGQYDKFSAIFWASGAAMGIRSAIFHRMGGFDARFFAHMEEIDLCWRIQRAGYKILFNPDSVVYHLGGGTLNYQSPRKIYLNFRNNLLMLLKNERAEKLLWLIPLRLVLDGIAGFKFMTEGNVKYTTAVLKAHWGFYSSFIKYLKIRKEDDRLIENLRNSQHITLLVYPKSIVWQFYINKLKKFSQLKF